MEKNLKTILLSITFLTLFTVPVAASPLRLNDLVENAVDWNNQTVVISAEAIGEPLERADGTWINVSDGSNAMGIWMSAEEARRIKVFGQYETRGDQLLLTGQFHRACPEHGGEADIHLSSMSITSPGERIKTPVSTTKVLSAMGMFILAAGLSAYYLSLRIRKRTQA